MKKILLVLLLTLSLCACTKKEEKVELKFTNIESYDVDMSSYQGVSSTQHCFKGIAPSEIAKIVEEGGSAVIFMGFKGCHVCQESTKYLDEVAKELGVTIYYLNCTSELYPLKDKTYDDLIALLDPILNTNEEGVKTIYTPHLFTITNGKINKGHISVVESWTEGNPSEESIEELQNIYRDILKDFAK